jgi:glycosyltransferase involved in cell wall biosynthesis
LVRNGLGKTYYSRRREPLLLDGYARQIRRTAAKVSPDLVLALSTIPIAQLDIDVPIVTWTDATFAGMLDFYPSYSNISSRYRRLGHLMEGRALQRVSLAVYSSRWAARTAVESYGVPEDSAAVVPFGANIPDPGPISNASAVGGLCKLLLVGRGWSRKGVDLAIETVQTLRRRGVPAQLDVVGSAPPDGVTVPSFVTVHGALEKDETTGAEHMRKLYASANFYILPTRADCTPVVLAEAQAYGIPVVTSNTGGTSSMIRAGQSGYALDLGAFPWKAANDIASAWAEQDRYAALRREARRMYEESLNWASATGALLQAVRERNLLTRH